jgi:two-component system sensor histidine kinase VicK
MSIARTIAEWHGGKIWLESQEQEGATFHIRIPKE